MKLAPYAMFLRLLHEWKDICTARETAQKVKHFFHVSSDFAFFFLGFLLYIFWFLY
jgi:hypothetical protein